MTSQTMQSNLMFWRQVPELQFTALSRRIGPTIPVRIDLINGYIIFRTETGQYHGHGTGATAEVLAEAGIRSSEPLAATTDNGIRVSENKALILPGYAYELLERCFEGDTWETTHLPTIAVEMELDKTSRNYRLKWNCTCIPIRRSGSFLV